MQTNLVDLDNYKLEIYGSSMDKSKKFEFYTNLNCDLIHKIDSIKQIVSDCDGIEIYKHSHNVLVIRVDSANRVACERVRITNNKNSISISDIYEILSIDGALVDKIIPTGINLGIYKLYIYKRRVVKDSFYELILIVE